jgi:hypothetical protein
MIPTPSSVPPDSRPVVILDAPGRAAEIHGSAPHALGRPVVHAGERDADAVLALDPAVILLSSEWTHEWRLIAAAARRGGVPVVYVMDGVIEWSYLWNNLSFIRPWGTMLQPLIASDLCVIGRHPARILSSLGLADRIHVVGLPRFDALPRERVLRAGTRPRLLVATARTAGHDVEQQVMTRRALRDLKAWLDTQPQIEPVWRIAADLAEDIGVNADIVGGFSEVLAGCAALLSFTSTCVLEAMHKRIPVAIIDYRAVPLYVTAAWEIRCAEHLPGVIQELLYPPPQKLAWQDACLADELETGGATAALVSVLRAAIDRPRAAPDETPAPAPDRPDGRLDFRQVHSELSAFSLGSLPVLQYELSAAHHLLRHTRHEKGFLQRDALELSEAFCGGDIRQTRVFSLLDQLPGAGLEGSASVEHVAIEGRAVRALVTPAPARLTYAIPCGLPGRLSLAISLHPRCWDRPDSGPCRLIISADETTLLDATLDLRDAPEDRKWWWFDLAVPAAAHGAHTLVLQTLGVDGDAARDAVWRAPLFHWRETENAPDANAGFRPRLAAGADFYVPGRTVA